MIQLRLTFDDSAGGHPAPPPSVCPRPGCGGGRVRHWQTVGKPVRGSASGTVTAERYICLDCRRTFRVYPAGIDRGTVPAAVKHWAAALHALGLPYRDVSRALAVLGVDLGKSRVQMLAKPLAGAGKPRPGWLGAVLERVEIEGEATDEGKATHDDTSAGARATAPGSGVQAERRAWVWIDGRRHALRRVVNARGQAALVVDGVARDLFYIVDAWAGAMLAQHGVHAAVSYAGDTNRCRDDARSGSPFGDLWWTGGPPPAGDARAPDRDPDAPGLDPDAADLAAAVAAADPGGHPSDPSGMPFPHPPGDPPALPPPSPSPSIAPLPERPDRRPAPRRASVGASPGTAPSRRDRAHSIGPGAPFGAPAPRVDRARHGVERLMGPESKRPCDACRASRAPSAPRIAA